MDRAGAMTEDHVFPGENPSSLHYFAASPPAPGRVIEVRPGLFWARMRLPFKPGHVNIWLLQDAGGWTIVDAGIDTPEARHDLAVILDELGDPPVRRMLVTHGHLDHVGLAGWLCDRTGAPLAMPRTEWLQARLIQTNADIGTWQAFYRLAGCPAGLIDGLPAYCDWRARQVERLPSRFHRIGDGTSLVIGTRN